ncbi:serine/threonine-protein kinase ATG1a isoform X3 [Populus trichocarpa]|uniref:serine/threonine-protein kinase ATG1a isoform X3 n=1 Tax=Populus trichocarpa TaxID=3694 RepID=UPI000D187CEC|nr:serine/threonine-protein kinase ATG1a isoform X3 [Populus trichocarpa]|eukprot:XP_024441074.1 serine/threonine-protein kinase ATG1a isoform X4 [Populus trichocarpa]
MEPNQTRLVGDYILGSRIGRGSFAVVWRSIHRFSGLQVAVKEIDKKLLTPKTEDRIFLVLEYCEGGDLAFYIQRHGKVTEAVARHFMRQLAVGLQVLQEKHLIHRDLKPQNLLLSSNDLTPQLKIGDFGFARSLASSDLADTLCGSPLYMAPEIIQNKKYDAKADLWSVGAILFQLVTGKPPFDGNSQYQLFQNILTSTELRFPQGALEELHPDCVDLCRGLLRRNPVERLTFKEFFNHKFLGEPRLLVSAKSSPLPQVKSVAGQFDASASDTRSQLEHDNLTVLEKVCDRNESVHGSLPNIVHDRMGKSADGSQSLSDQLRVADLMESIEKDYVIVNRHFASMENFSYYLETSLHDSSTSKASIYLPQKNNQDTVVATQTKEFTGSSVGSANNPEVHGSEPLSASCVPTILREAQRLPILHPSIKLQFLNQYAQEISELAQEKYDAGMFLESFSVELVVLAIWKRALEICEHWVASTGGSKLHESSSANESALVYGGTNLTPPAIGKLDFIEPSSACKWAEKGFILAFDHAEKLSNSLRDMDAAAEMPDAMELIFQKALAVGTSGAVDEYMENKGGADNSYSKAMLLLHFIMEEATSLPLNPPFSLTPASRKRVKSYILNLQSRRSRFSMLQPFPEQSSDSLTK